MLSNMACSLIEHKRINTTVAKAKALKMYVEPLITKSKTDSTHSRRVVFSYLKQKEAVSELFREVSTKVADRPGGYTRIIRTGNRLGDNADMCMIELVDYNELYTKETKTKSKRSRRGGKKKSGGAAPAAKKTEAASATADDLTKVEGIGPKVAEALKAGGVTTFAALAAATPDSLVDLISSVAGGHVPDTWPQQAKLAADGKWDDLQKLQDTLDGGKPAKEEEE